MRTIHFSDDYELSVQGSPWALFEYQREFSTDGDNADFFTDFAGYIKGIIPGFDEENLDGEDVAEETAENAPVEIDIIFLLKMAWAMARNYDPAFPSFADWARTAPIPMRKTAPWTMEVQAAIFAEIFRNESSSEEKGSGQGTARRRSNRRKTNSGS